MSTLGALGAEGIVSKRLGSRYHGGPSRDWLKTKCHATGWFFITGFQELGPGRLEALHITEEIEGGLAPAGQVRFGFAHKGLWRALDTLRAGAADQDGVVPIEPELSAEVKFFGRHKGGAIRDGVLLSVEELPLPRPSGVWSCDTDAVVLAMSSELEVIRTARSPAAFNGPRLALSD